MVLVSEQLSFCLATRLRFRAVLYAKTHVHRCFKIASMAENLAEQSLVQELLLSPAVCDLINSTQPDADTHNDSSFPQGNDNQGSPERKTVAVLQLTVQTLLKDCQQRTCTSSDTTLALKGLSDQSSVDLQVHRCVLILC